MEGEAPKLVLLLPVYCPRPWGRQQLGPLFVDSGGAVAPIGEVWVSSTACGIEGSQGPIAGLTLGGLWEQMGKERRGDAVTGWGRFPLLAKFLFTADKLSVQVHPEDEFARRHEGEPWGKSEVWYVLEAEPGAWVRVGLKQEVGRTELERIFGSPAVEQGLRQIPLRPGDVVSIPAGTLHSIGPGLVLCEIQQYSDVTYRVYDYERLGLDGQRRWLHLEKARAAVHLNTPEAGRLCPPPLKEGREGRVLFSGARFVVQHFSSTTQVSSPVDPSHFDLVVFLKGSGAIGAGGEGMRFKPGDAFLVAANAGGMEVAPNKPSEWLRTYPVGEWQ